ncbi:MAG: hypothetical protein QMD04_14895, partial [Anaerolineales bacterium]|nr:hypothetical protein [Anaerolineales bacterium]
HRRARGISEAILWTNGGGQAPSRHVFAATLLRVDNAGALYAFCPEHTFTTYSVAEDSKPRPKPTHLRSLAHFFDSLVFRLTLNLEALRGQMMLRR